MDSTFIGLIFSCFNADPNSNGRVEMTSFQTGPSNDRIEVPTEVSPTWLDFDRILQIALAARLARRTPTAFIIIFVFLIGKKM